MSLLWRPLIGRKVIAYHYQGNGGTDMAMRINDSEKSTLEKMYCLCEVISNMTKMREHLGLEDEAEPMKKILQINITCFLAYLAASDGVLSWDECRYISDVMGLDITPNKLRDFIEEQNVYSEAFEEDVPMILQLFVAMDNAVYQENIDIEEELGQAIIRLYMLLGKGLIESNGRTIDTMDSEERANFQGYIERMSRYVEDKTTKHHVDVLLGFNKRRNTDSVETPKKSEIEFKSVKAPAKKQ